MSTNTENVIGKDAKAYHNTGTDAVPVWVELKRIQDLSIPLGADDVEVKCRDSDWAYGDVGFLNAGVDFDYLHKKGGGDTVFEALMAAFTGRNAVQFAIMDGDVTTTGSVGLKAFMLVNKLEQSQQMAEAVKYSVGLKPARVEEASALVEPSWFEVA